MSAKVDNTATNTLVQEDRVANRGPVKVQFISQRAARLQPSITLQVDLLPKKLATTSKMRDIEWKIREVNIHKRVYFKAHQREGNVKYGIP